MADEIIKCEFTIDGDADEAMHFAESFEGTAFGSDPASGSFARIFPPPRGISDSAADDWRREHWGTPRDVLYDEPHESSSGHIDFLLCKWLLATQEKPPREFARRVSAASQLKVSLAYVSRFGWGAELYRQGWIGGYCFISRDRRDPEARGALAKELLAAFHVWTDLETWSGPRHSAAIGPEAE